MSRPKRSLVAAALAAAEQEFGDYSRDDVMAPQRDVAPPAPAAATQIRPSAKGGVRHGYRTSLYLPREAQFKLREIALMKRCKPHDVLLEAMAEMFEKYNAAELAAQLRKTRARPGA